MALNFLPQPTNLLQGTLSESLNASATEVDVSNPPSASDLPTYLTIEPESSSLRETIRVIGVSGNTITIERGVFNGGVGTPHDPSVAYEQRMVSEFFEKWITALEQGYMAVDSSLTLTRNSATEFQISSEDYTDFFTEGRIIRFNGTDNLLALVSSSTYTGGNTVVTINSAYSIPATLSTVDINVFARGASNLFPAVTDVLNNSFSYATSGGTANAQTLTLSPVPSAYVAGMRIVFKAGATNTGATTINVNSLGVKTIKKDVAAADLDAGDITTGAIIELVYDGTYFQLVSRVNVNDIWQEIDLPAESWTPTTTNGCADPEKTEAATNDVDYFILAFDQTTQERAFKNFRMPTNWDGGDIQFRFIWTTAAGGASETVELEMLGRAFTDDDAIDQASGTAVGVSDTWIADGDIHTSAWSSDLTLAGSPAGGQLVHLEIRRDVANDDLGGDAQIIGVEIRYKITQLGS